MNKMEFMVYLKFLSATMNVKAPEGKDAIQAWYEPFENIHFDIAKKMAKMYLKKETGYFKLAKLLEYKNPALKSCTYPEYEEVSSKKCDICRDTGFVWIKPKAKKDEIAYDIFRKCYCSKGAKLQKYVRMITNEDLRNMKQESNGRWEEI